MYIALRERNLDAGGAELIENGLMQLGQCRKAHIDVAQIGAQHEVGELSPKPSKLMRGAGSLVPLG